MRIASKLMSPTLIRYIEEHGAKALRYCVVSVVNVVVGLGTLALCLAVLDMHRVPSNLTAWMVSTIPAYLMSRHWVWQQTGANSVRSEIVPFWILALTGLGFSTVSIAVAGTMTDHTLLLMFVNLCAYGVVWVAKYLVLDNLMWSHDASEAEIGTAPEVV